MFRRRMNLFGTELRIAIEFQRPFMYSDNFTKPSRPLNKSELLYEVDAKDVKGFFKEILVSLSKEMNFTFR